MAIKKCKPTTNGLRHMTYLDNRSLLTKNKPEKSLLKVILRKSGRNNQGKITVRHRGGGSKIQYRMVDFKRDKDGIFAKVKSIEYDPIRSANISLVVYADGEKRYIITPRGLKVGKKIISGKDVDIKVGNALKLEDIPEGTMIHNIELYPGSGGKLIRSAGGGAQVLGKDKDGKYVIIKLKSGETRKILAKCKATIGVVGNEEHALINWGKAGRNRHRGIRPTVRGSAMNPNDHPHGGGEGKQPIGRKTPMTPWGKRGFGVKTRNEKKASTKLIVHRRKRGR